MVGVVEPSLGLIRAENCAAPFIEGLNVQTAEYGEELPEVEMLTQPGIRFPFE